MRKLLIFCLLVSASALLMAADTPAQKASSREASPKTEPVKGVNSDYDFRVISRKVEIPAGYQVPRTDAEPPVGFARVKAELAELDILLEQSLRSGADANALKLRRAELQEILAEGISERSRSLDQGGENCDFATTINSLPYCDPGTTSGFTDDVTPPLQCGFSEAPDVMYAYYCEADETVTVSVCGSCFDTILHIWDGCPTEGGTVIACNDDNPICNPAFTSCISNVPLQAGHVYYIVVDGFGSSSGPYNLNMVRGSVCVGDPCRGLRPGNDLCQNAINVAVPGQISGTTRNASLDFAPECAGEAQTAPGVWYKVVGTGARMTASTCGFANYDSKISIYCADCDRLPCIASNDDACNSLRSEVSWCSSEGTEYLILVHGYACATGNFRLSVWDDGELCENPIPCCFGELTLDAPGTVSSSTCDAGNDCFLRPSQDRFIVVNIPTAGRWTFSLCGSPSWDSYLYIGTSCCAADVCWNDDSECNGEFSLLSTCPCLELAAGTYYVTVEGFWPESCGEFTLSVTPCGPPPVGEECDNPYPIAELPYSTSGTTCGRLNDYDDLSACSFGNWMGSPDVAYRYVPPVDQYVTIDLCGSEYDVAVIVYDNGVFYACNDDDSTCVPNHLGARLTCLPMLAGHVYCIVVDGYGGACGNYTLDLRVCPPPPQCRFPYDAVDLGDLARCNYPTLHGNPGHGLSGVAWLGEGVDGEGAPRILDQDRFDDGIVYLNPPWMPCQTHQVVVTVTAGQQYGRYVGCGGLLYLNGWKDGNLDGDFCDELCVSEWIVRDLIVVPGQFTLDITDPGVFDIGVYDGVFRWRLTSVPVGRYGFGLVDPAGQCPDMTCGTFGLDSVGEVEDYVVSDLQLFVELTGGLIATSGDHTIRLSWATASETNNEAFEIVRNDQVVGSVSGAINSQTTRHYEWSESGLENGETYTYQLRSVTTNGARQVLATVSAVPNPGPATVSEYRLYQNYPNPFNPSTLLAFDLVEASHVVLKVYNPVGQVIALPVNGEVAAGHHEVIFDGANLPTGLYFYTIEVGNVFRDTKKMLLVK